MLIKKSNMFVEFCWDPMALAGTFQNKTASVCFTAISDYIKGLTYVLKIAKCEPTLIAF